jgi:hypothetical protein
MQRRSEEIRGCVNFPIANPLWKNSKEGGMVVKLVVIDPRDFEDQFGLCCGAQVHDVLTEVLLGSDKHPHPERPQQFDTPADVKDYEQACMDWQATYFPDNTSDEKDLGVLRFLSRDYLAAVVLGVTGWSGWNEPAGKYWICQPSDLSEDGQALYRQLENLYPGCELHLLTYLDT